MPITILAYAVRWLGEPALAKGGLGLVRSEATAPIAERAHDAALIPMGGKDAASGVAVDWLIG